MQDSQKDAWTVDDALLILLNDQIEVNDDLKCEMGSLYHNPIAKPKTKLLWKNYIAKTDDWCHH